jgi:hypothetical protein
MGTQPPNRPFTTADLPSLGLTRAIVGGMMKSGQIARVLYGGYLPTELVGSIEAHVELVASLLPEGHVVSGRTAAWLYGVDTYAWTELGHPPPIDVCVAPAAEPSKRVGIAAHTRDLRPEDITEERGIRITTPLRTALDLGCMLHPREALAALDALARLHDFTVVDLQRELPRFRGRRGVRQLRELVPLVDPRAESPRESWTRLEIIRAGLPVPTPQVWIRVDGVPTYRLDLAYPHRRVAVEYDGFEGHERTPEQREHDEARRAWLRRNGWIVIVVRVGDFSAGRLERWLGELREALAPSYTPVRKLERGPVRG